MRLRFLLKILLPLHLAAALITTTAYRDFCDIILDQDPIIFDPTLVKKGDAIFVKRHNLNPFLKIFFPQISEPFILVTGVGGGTLDQRYLPYLETEKIAHWFSINAAISHPKLTALPLGVPTKRAKAPESIALLTSHFSPAAFFCEKSIPIYINWSNSSIERKNLLPYFAEQEGCQLFPRVRFEQYVRQIASSRYVISPKGLNIDCFRTWEALYAGAIPVVESLGIDAIYEGLPIIIVPKLNQITLEALEKEFEQLKTKSFEWERLELSYWIDQMEACRRKIKCGL